MLRQDRGFDSSQVTAAQVDLFAPQYGDKVPNIKAVKFAFADRALAGLARLLRLVGRGLRRQLRQHRGRPLALGALRSQRRARQDAARARGRLADGGGREIVGDAALLLGAGGVDQPHQQEERHHGGDEVGVGDLPGPAVVGAARDLLHLLDHDRQVVVQRHGDPANRLSSLTGMCPWS